MAIDALTQFFADLRVKRVLSLATFVGLLVVFRHLVPLLIFFLVFARGFDWLAHRLGPLARLPPKAMIAVLVVLLGGGLALAGYLGVHRAVPVVAKAREIVPQKVEAFKRTPLYQQLEAHKVELGKYTAKAEHALLASVAYLQATGRILLHALFGFILAMIYLFDKREVDAWMAKLPRHSYGDMLLSYLRILSDAIVVTVKLQVIVAAVNAVLTLPVLLLLKLPHIPTLFVLIFVFGLVPVLGNFFSGVILMAVTYAYRGVWGVVVFAVLTFVLHKVESYYLNPRLASAHVKMPSLAIVVSLILFEHMFGVAGLFMSFPCLYIAYGVRAYFRGEHEPIAHEETRAAAA